MYFSKLLIANRGEIARRIIRTCKRLGISTVAVYSEADANQPFVHEADEAVLIGPSIAAKSYLNMNKIVEVAIQTSADAVHPGYGFLSENAEFAKMCRRAGVVFIGPSESAIESMGNKILARQVMQRAGVPIVPGYDGKLESVEHAVSVGHELGYPLMLKASAGGGGIGMQLVHSEEELRRTYESTMQKAANFFGDGTVFLEKWIRNPRHIEVQVMADDDGNVVHLFERECSVQRRHQKVIEESLSPSIDDGVRARLCDAAVKGVEAIGYTNAGTMEFIFDEDANFYFLEMNTRLQVEHPVTEMVTGLDLVELQIRIASGEALPFGQEQIRAGGHAVECRLYAEDPVTFFPSPGTVTKMVLPQNGTRYDFGIQDGTVVSPYYDPMLGKIICHGIDRAEALAKMKETLLGTELEGIKTNRELLLKILDNEEFQEGRYSTQLVAQVLGTA